MTASAFTPVPPPHPVAPALLGRLVELLVLAARDMSGPPLLLRLRSNAHGIELGTVPADDVYAELAGTALEAEWHGLGVLVSGRARSMGGVAGGVGPGQVIGSSVTAMVVWRDGTVVSALSVDAGEPRVQVDRPDAPPGRACMGRLVDVVRRAAGLHTPAPTRSPAELGATLWLHRVHATAVSRVPVDVATIDALAPPLPASWAAWREQCAQGAWPELGIAPPVAEWMDDGMFAREALGAFPDAVEVLEHLAELLAPQVWDHLVVALAAHRDPGSY